MRIQRKQVTRVLQQHQRLTNRLARHRAMLGRTEQLEMPRKRAGRRTSFVEDMSAHLYAQDAAHGIIQSCRADLAGLHLLDCVVEQLLPAVRGHQHVDTGIDRVRAAESRTARHLTVPVPVSDHEAVEPHSPFEHVSQQPTVAVHLHSLPARE